MRRRPRRAASGAGCSAEHGAAGLRPGRAGGPGPAARCRARDSLRRAQGGPAQRRGAPDAEGADRGSGYPVLRGHGLCALQLRAGPGRGEPQSLYALLRRLRLGALRAHALAFCAAIFQFCCQMAVQSGPTGAQVLVKTPKNQIFSKKYLPKNSHKVYNDEKPPRAVPPRRNKPRRGWPR